MDNTTIAIITTVGTIITSIVIKVLDYRKHKDVQDRLEREKERAHELEMENARSETALRASIVGVERHKKTLTPEGQALLKQAIQEAAEEEDIESHLKEQVNLYTKNKGTKFFDPKRIKKA